MKNKFLTAATMGFLVLGSSSCSEANSSKPAESTNDPDEIIKCYGGAKSSNNDCGNAAGKHGCAGRSKKDFDPCEWRAMARSECNTIKNTSEKPINCPNAKVNK